MGYLVTIALSLAMGLSIFLSMPIVLHKDTGARRLLFFNAVAIGILVFLLMDLYGDVAGIFGNAQIASPPYFELLFIAGFALTFLFFIAPKRGRDPVANPKRTSLVSALGIGFQNLTEGLVFGAAASAGLASIYVLSLVGFSLQNVTEGFPIAMPLMHAKSKVDKRFMAGAFLVGGIPTVIGAIIGLKYYSNAFIIFFDALASAAILYVVIILVHVNLKSGPGKKPIKNAMWLTYLGIMAGFVIAFVVNYAVAPL